jgi:hypothetical protein
MATLSQILSRRWSGSIWRLDADLYASLQWLSGDPQPTESEIQAFSASVDTEIEAEQRARRQELRLFALGEKNAELLQVIEVLALAIQDLQAKIRAQALTNPLTTVSVTRVTALVNKVEQARAIT